MAVRVIAGMRVYNEADILGQVLNHLHKQGIFFVIVDGGSQDGSVEIAKRYANRGLLEHRVIVRDFSWPNLDLACLNEMASRYTPDWILRNDADEFLEAQDAGMKLSDAIAEVDRRGFNIIQFDNFEFYLTEKDRESVKPSILKNLPFFRSEPDIRSRLLYYSWSDDYRYKAWKYSPEVSDSEAAGHYPVFPSSIKAKVYPQKFVMRHYRFRSPEQGLRRVFGERLPRYAPELRARGWNYHHDHFKENPQFFILDSNTLSKYDGEGKWNTSMRPNRIGPSVLPGYRSRQELFGT